MTASKDAYYERAQSWASDREAALRTSRKAAWIVAGVAAGIAALEAVALATLVPLKTTEPYTLLVDRHTGFVQKLDAGEQGVKAEEALTQSLLAQYVIAREGFDISSVKGDYRRVALWSADAARREYLALMPTSNPESPFNRLPRGAVVAVTVKSVSPIEPGAAMVRFETRRSDQPGTAAYVAVIRYRYSGAPMAIEDRLVNPLGFQVVKYRRDQEAVSPQPEAAPEPAAATTNAAVYATPAVQSAATGKAP